MVFVVVVVGRREFLAVIGFFLPLVLVFLDVFVRILAGLISGIFFAFVELVLFVLELILLVLELILLVLELIFLVLELIF